MIQERLMRVMMSYFFIFFSSVTFAKKNEIKTLDSIKNILSLKTGRYETVMAKSNFTMPDVCEPSEIDFDLIDSNGEVVLAIGSKLVFSNLQAAETKTKTKTQTQTQDSCEYKIFNKIEPQKLTQNISQSCTKKESNFTKNRVLEFKNNEVIYSFNESSSIESFAQNKNTTQKNVCVYSLITLKENKDDKK